MLDTTTPSPSSKDWRTTRARLAAHARHNPGSDPPDELVTAHVTAALEEHVRRVVDRAPPLSAEQRERIAAILRPAITTPVPRAEPA